jgi:hypothetical protein
MGIHFDRSTGVGGTGITIQGLDVHSWWNGILYVCTYVCILRALPGHSFNRFTVQGDERWVDGRQLHDTALWLFCLAWVGLGLIGS